MSITIEPSFLLEVKSHLRIYHNDDDDLIENEINTAIFNIFTIYLQIPELNSDGTANSNFPENTKDMDERVKLAVKHYVAMLRMNPDERIELMAGRSAIVKDLIQRILGSKLPYIV